MRNAGSLRVEQSSGCEETSSAMTCVWGFRRATTFCNQKISEGTVVATICIINK